METRLPAPCVVVLIGPSSSGKSTWAAANFAPTEIVSSDELRSRVGINENDLQASTVAFQLLDTIVSERVSRKLTTVIDTLGFDRDRREEWISAAHANGLPVYAVTFDTTEAECLERNSLRPRPLNQATVRKQMKTHRDTVASLDNEGFDAVLEQKPVRTVAPQLVNLPDETDPGRNASHTFGLMVSRFDWNDADLGKTLGKIAGRAETVGFRDIWVMDHFRQIASVGRPWEDIPEAYTTLAYLAGQTTTIRLGALVTGITHRNPSVLGKMIATLDAISGGRAIAGLGIGWDREEHDGYGIGFPPTRDRYQILIESIELLRLLWGKGTPSYQGEFVQGANLSCYPRPIQDPIPILIGGSGEKRTLRLVAEYADAANVFGNPDRVAHKVSILKQHCDELGRNPDDIEVTHLLTAMPGDSRNELDKRVDRMRPASVTREEFSKRNNAGLAEDLIGLFSQYQEAGANHSIVAIPDPQLAGSIEAFAPIIAAMAK
jgi:F420-dependent oxidoreductase-like protein